MIYTLVVRTHSEDTYSKYVSLIRAHQQRFWLIIIFEETR